MKLAHINICKGRAHCRCEQLYVQSHIAISGMILKGYKETEDNYNLGVEWHAKKSLSFNWSKQLKKFANSLQGKTVLDIGCGTGRDIDWFINQGIKAEGLDFSRESIEFAKKKFPQIKFYQKNMLNTGFVDKSYD